MSQPKQFFPQPVYAPSGAERIPQVMHAPAKYIQGVGCLESLGRYVSMLGFERVALLASSRGHNDQAQIVTSGFQAAGIQSIPAVFGGECSAEEISSHIDELQPQSVDCLLALGGGKCVDTGKCVSHRLGVPLIVVPTLASNDAPCSAVSVLYTPEGVVSGAEFFPQNPIMVVVDTQVVADADVRYLVAGMGDAMATWYEARVCLANAQARNVLGARPTLTAGALGELCAHTLYAEGAAAVNSVAENQVDPSLEKVVEANTLLSGVGFESGGLAGAHGFAEGYTRIPAVERQFLHGEMVAMGVMSQLMMERDTHEAERVAEFFVSVGLPVHLEQLGLSGGDPGIDEVVEGALAFAPIHNLPFAVDANRVKEGLVGANQLGMRVSERLGDTAYRRLHQ